MIPEIWPFVAVERDTKASHALADKRSQFAVLKEQMEMAVAHRAAEKKQQMEEDDRCAKEAAELEQEIMNRTELVK
jgi:hypothetical protein